MNSQDITGELRLYYVEFIPNSDTVRKFLIKIHIFFQTF